MCGQMVGDRGTCPALTRSATLLQIRQPGTKSNAWRPAARAKHLVIRERAACIAPVRFLSQVETPLPGLQDAESLGWYWAKVSVLPFPITGGTRMLLTAKSPLCLDEKWHDHTFGRFQAV